MVAPESTVVIDATKSDTENPNFIFYSKSFPSFTNGILSDLSSSGIKAVSFDASKMGYAPLIQPTKETTDAQVLIFENVESSDAISAGLLIALIMTRLTGKEEFQDKTVVLVSGTAKWRGPDLKKLFEELIEEGTVINPL